MKDERKFLCIAACKGDFCYIFEKKDSKTWNIQKNFLSLQRQNDYSGYPGRIPRGQDYIDTTHLKEPHKGSFYFKYLFINILT